MRKYIHQTKNVESSIDFESTDEQFLDLDWFDKQRWEGWTITVGESEKTDITEWLQDNPSSSLLFEKTVPIGFNENNEPVETSTLEWWTNGILVKSYG